MLIGEEAHPAYDRPPLSKRLFDGGSGIDELRLAGESAFAALDIDARYGRRAERLDLDGHTIFLDNGEMVPWEALVIATGAAPVQLPGGALTLRTFDDAVAIGAAMSDAERIVVVGAGVLGCELAALGATQGKAVAVVDPQPAPMIDKVGPDVAARLLSLHAAHGVQMHFGHGVAGIEDSGGGERTVRLADGTRHVADLVLVAIGCRPATAWLSGSGVPVENGVVCDRFCRALPQVYAAGDVASWFNPRFGRQMRIEHRMNATEQGMAVAANLMGAEDAFAPIPFFWTDQYDVKIQVHGLVDGQASTVPLAGDPQSDSFVVGYVRGGLVEGVLGWNMPRETRKARSLIGQPPPNNASDCTGKVR